jgi:hypothetical protein
LDFSSTTSHRPGRARPMVVALLTSALFLTGALLATPPARSAGPISFGTGTSISIPAGAADVAIGDLDADGYVDLMTGGGTQTSVLYGKAGGGYDPVVAYSTGGSVFQVLPVDLNNDDLPDLVVTRVEQNKVSVSLNLGSRTFAAPYNVTVGSWVQSVCAGDFNGDGSMDLAATNKNSNSVSVLLNDGSGTVSVAQTVGGWNQPQRIVAGDVDGDCLLDLLIAKEDGIGWARGSGTGSFTVMSGRIGTNQICESVVTRDLNGDGKLDVASPDRPTDKITVMLGDGAGAFPTVNSTNANIIPHLLDAGDLDNDGDVDLAASNDSTEFFSYYANDGSGALAAPVYVRVAPDGTATIRGFALGDLNDDGKVDGVSGNSKGALIVSLNDSPASALPGAPAYLRARAEDGPQVTLSWRDGSGNEDGFAIDRRGPGSDFVEVGTVAAGETSFVDTTVIGLTPYVYQVRAYNASGSSAPSPQAQTKTHLGPVTAPEDLVATPVSAEQIDLSWTDTTAQEDGFEVEFKQGSDEFAPLATTGVNETTYQHTGLAPESTYTYQVRAFNSLGVSEYSDEATATTLETPPAPPTDLAVRVTGPTKIAVSWKDGSAAETGFELDRSTDGGTTWPVTTSVGPEAGVGAIVTLSVSGLTPGLTYTFRVRAMSPTNHSDYAGPKSVVLSAPAVPEGFGAVAVSTTRINVSWTDAASNETYFRLERSTDGGATYPFAVNVSGRPGTGAVVAYANTGLAPSTTYTYRVRAVNGAGSSPNAGPLSATTFDPPAAPTDFTAAPISTTRIRLTWTDNATSENGFRLERSVDGGSTWPAAFTIAPSAGTGLTVTYVSTGLSPSTTYTYRVRAHSGSLVSDYAGPVSAATYAPPATPTDLVAVRASSSSIKLTWMDNAIGEQGYKLERSTDGGATWTLIINVPRLEGTGEKTYLHKGLATGVTYTYRVRAYSDTYFSDYSNTASATP